MPVPEQELYDTSLANATWTMPGTWNLVATLNH